MLAGRRLCLKMSFEMSYWSELVRGSAYTEHQLRDWEKTLSHCTYWIDQWAVNVSHLNKDVFVYNVWFAFCVCVCQVGDDWYLEGCEQKCVCHSGGLIQCHNSSCKPTTENCQLQDGEYECRPLGSYTRTQTHTHTANTLLNILFEQSK